MNHRIRHYIVIGSSRGLGAAIVDELLKTGSSQVIGIARTRLEDIKNHGDWLSSKRYTHVQLDIGSSEAHESLKLICSQLNNVPVCIIFNAACMDKDVNADCSINYNIFRATNRVGIDGLGNVLNAFEDHLITYGGILVGISSFSALSPSVVEPKVAYSASKAYLDMTLRCFRFLWKEKVSVVTVHLGHVGSPKITPFTKWMVPTYSNTARKIVRSISGERIPSEINYPFLYCIAYKYFFTLMPDIIYFRVVRFFMKIAHLIKGGTP